jgi:hypothetical protein
MMKSLKYPNLQNWRWRKTSLFRDHQNTETSKTQDVKHKFLHTQGYSLKWVIMENRGDV